MEDDVAEEELAIRADLASSLGRLPMFETLDEATRREIAATCEWMSLPGGSTLFEVGEPSDAMYVVLSGALATLAPRSSDRRRFMGRALAGETVGEMGLISGRERTATVVALRDSEVARLSREAFDRVFLRHPQAMLRIAQLMVNRVEASNAGARGRPQGPRTFTLVPQSIDVDVAGFAMQFVEALRTRGRAELVWSARGADHTSHWFHTIEAANDYVIYVGEHLPSPWSRLCSRQADSLLLLARAESEAGPWAALQGAREARMAPQRSELVLMHGGGRITPGAAARWMTEVPGVPHHHVCGERDVARLARLVTGAAVGLVLSGGGARGFAHIGVIRALRERGVPIDLVGGTSIGAIMGAAAASEWSIEQMVTVFRRTFVDSNPLGDYTLPAVSLVSGRRVSERLRAEFGDVTIEDLPLPFYCVSTNLTTGLAGVHRSGPVWRWLRASVAIPGVLPPVPNGAEVHVDGATINNLPVDVMREMNRGKVIGVDVGNDRAFTGQSEDADVPPLWRVMDWLRGRRRRPNIFQILWRAGMITSAVATAQRREQTDLLLQPALESVDLLAWRSFDRAIEAGYRCAIERLDATPQQVPSGPPPDQGSTGR